jgi:hypothetical protein
LLADDRVGRVLQPSWRPQLALGHCSKRICEHLFNDEDLINEVKWQAGGR